MPAAPVIVLVALAFIVLIIGSMIWAAKAKKKRLMELQAWAHAHGCSFYPGEDYSFDERFPDFDCLRRGDDRYAFNIIDGTFGERGLSAFDYHYKTTSTDSKGRRTTTHHHFSAVILNGEMRLDPLHIRREHFFDKVSGFFGFDDIDFESAEFSRKFHVKSPNRKWAFEVINQKAMEMLLAAPRLTLQMDHRYLIAYGNRRFKPAQFDEALHVATSLLDCIPKDVVEERRLV